MSNLITKAKAESMNKTQLVDKVLEFQAIIDAASGQPLSSAALEKRLLDLGESTTQVKLKSETAKQEYEIKLAEINANKEKELRKLELEFGSEQGKSAEELNAAYTELEAKAKAAIDNLSYGLKEAEIQAKADLAKIEDKVKEAQSAAETKISDLEESVKTTKAKTESEISKMKTDHSRDVEQLEYDNKLAIRDLNEKAADKIAKGLNKELIDSEELKNLKNFQAESEEAVQAKIDAAVASAKKEVYASEGAKYGILKSSTDQEIALLKNDKTHLEASNRSQAERIADLEERLKDVPAQIAKAVEAAKSNVSVNQTGSGK